MGKDKEVRGRVLSTPLNLTLQGGCDPQLARSHGGEWEGFESFLHIPEEGLPWFTVCVGEGGRWQIKHGTFPRVSEPIPATKSLEPLVGTCWRGLHCSYWVDTVRRELCLQVSGQVAGLLQGGERRVDWAEALLLKSWLAMAHIWFSCLDWGKVLSCPTLASAEAASRSRS